MLKGLKETERKHFVNRFLMCIKTKQVTTQDNRNQKKKTKKQKTY